MMRRKLLHAGVREALLSTTAIAALLAILAAADDRVRDQGVRLAHGEPPTAFTAATAKVGSAGISLLSDASYISLEQISLGMFIAVALVLVVCMIRT